MDSDSMKTVADMSSAEATPALCLKSELREECSSLKRCLSGEVKLLGVRPRNETESTVCELELDEDSTTDGNEDCEDLTEVMSASSPTSEKGELACKLSSRIEVHENSGHQKMLMLCVLIFLCMACGCSCQAPYEVLNTKDKGCAHLISLVEHLFGILVTLPAALKPRQLPLSWHMCLAAGSIGYTQLQNLALSTQLPTLVLITIKNGNLLANVFLGKLVLHRNYGMQQLAAVALLSFGLILVSVAGTSGDQSGLETGRSCLLGILLLAGALLSRAGGGLTQEQLSKSRTIPVEELLFFRSLLGLPAVLLQYQSIQIHGSRWFAGEVTFGWPGPWALLILNTVMDYVTRVCITLLIKQTSALTANLVLTVQRFVSFLISAVLLSREPPSGSLWLGAVAVLAGTLLYVIAPDVEISRSPKEKSA